MLNGEDWRMGQNLNRLSGLWVYQVQRIQSRRKVASGRKVVGTIRSLINDRGLQLEYSRVLHEILLGSILM